MPQIFQVLRCYKCLVFQVHQTKKSNKWDCKLCGEKQSIKRHYGLGAAKDCRLHVQRLNALRGEIDGLKNNEDSGNSDNEHNVQPTIKTTYQPIVESKWSNFMEETQVVEENSNEDMSFAGAKVVLEIPKKRIKSNNNFKSNPKATSVHYDEVHYDNVNNDNATLEIIPDDGIGNIKPQSLLSEPDLQSVDFTPQKKHFNTSKNITKTKFIPPVLNKNSKWAQFTENAEENESDIAPTLSIAPSQTDLLFSLCDDSDLDNVLDI